MFITPPKLIKSFDLFCICLRKKTPCAAPLRAPVVASCGAAKCKLQWQHLAALAGIELHCIAPHKKTHATTDLQCACNGLKRQSTGMTMMSIDAAASPSWQLLRQCHCNRVTPPHFFAFAQTKQKNVWWHQWIAVVVSRGAVNGICGMHARVIFKNNNQPVQRGHRPMPQQVIRGTCMACWPPRHACKEL